MHDPLVLVVIATVLAFVFTGSFGLSPTHRAKTAGTLGYILIPLMGILFLISALESPLWNSRSWEYVLAGGVVIGAILGLITISRSHLGRDD